MIGMDSSEGFMEVNAKASEWNCFLYKCTLYEKLLQLIVCIQTLYHLFHDSLQLPSEVGFALFSERAMKHRK